MGIKAPYHALKNGFPIDEQVKAIFVVLVEIVNLRVDQEQASLVYGESAVVGQIEVPAHPKVFDPVARSPSFKNTLVVTRSPVARVLVLTWEQSAVRPEVHRVHLTRRSQMPAGHLVIISCLRRQTGALEVWREKFLLSMKNDNRLYFIFSSFTD